MMKYNTEYRDIDVYLDGSSLVRFDYREGANTDIKPTYYLAGDFKYDLETRECSVCKPNEKHKDSKSSDF